MSFGLRSNESSLHVISVHFFAESLLLLFFDSLIILYSANTLQNICENKKRTRSNVCTIEIQQPIQAYIKNPYPKIKISIIINAIAQAFNVDKPKSKCC